MTKIKWNEYTWYSRLLALILFIIIIPALTFFIGIRYEQTVEVLNSTSALSVSPALPAAPTATTTTPVAPIAPSQTVTITASDMGQTIVVKKGESVLFMLGDLLWTLHFSDPSILSQMMAKLSAGYQGLYTAVEAGTTHVTGTGAPHCVAGQACPDFLQEFNVTIQVTN